MGAFNCNCKNKIIEDNKILDLNNDQPTDSRMNKSEDQLTISDRNIFLDLITKFIFLNLVNH